MEEDYILAEEHLIEQGINEADITPEMIDDEVVDISAGRIDNAMMRAEDDWIDKSMAKK